MPVLTIGLKQFAVNLEFIKNLDILATDEPGLGNDRH